MIAPDLPLIDLHRHLDGTIRLETILDLAARHGIRLPATDVEGLRPHVEVDGTTPDLMTFIGRFRWLTAVLADGDACRRIAYENVEIAREEGLDYVELRFSPMFMAETHGLDPALVTEAVVDGARAAVRDLAGTVEARLIGTVSRTYGPVICARELEALLSHSDHLVALDLAGDEGNFPAGLFSRHFARARDAGLAVTVHAGEAAGPESIWSSIRDLGARRIGHAVRAQEDPALLDFLVEQRIGIEANLTSNVQTSTVASYAAHPLRGYLERGILATLNTDDPTISGIDLAHEYDIAAPAAGLTPAQIRQAQANALEIAYLSDSEKQALRRKAARRSPSGPCRRHSPAGGGATNR